MENPAEVLRRVFGHEGFRGLQAGIVAHVMEGGSGLVLMPTGGGKSLCYQVPALCLPGLAVVVSPLIALMEDQVAALRQQGVAAAALHSDLDEEERFEIRRAMARGELRILYVSPERLVMDGTLDNLARREVSLFAIDEAHCVSQWGHHFRPEYRGLTVLAERFPLVPRLALTATADERTVDDIRRQLVLADAPVFRGGFDRPNIFITAEPRETERAQLRAFIKRASDGRGAGIIYCGSRRKTEDTAAWLKQDGHDAMAFHAGMEASAKREAHHRFARGDAVIMCATIAFGMGIDRPDVRWVAHTDLPKSPESWYQEIGRAGRDGLPAQALLLYGPGDIALGRHRIQESPASDEQKRIERGRLEAIVSIAESATCRRRALLRCFGEDLEEDCGACDACATPPKMWNGTVAAQKMLSAVLRTGQRFGLGHIIDVLRGRMTDKIAQHGHDQLPTFGVGKDLPDHTWRGVARQLVSRGALDVAVENHGELLPTDQARPILKGETQLMLRADTVSKASTPRESSAPERGEDPVFDALRQWRRDEARNQGVPAYVIFQDKTLAEIAYRKPRSLDGLAGVPGVGTSKLDKYGDAVLEVLLEAGA
ncbi:DNA helicase RecQ [Rhodovarius crocodyli]|uniref:DNA helicase RecQ n=1 Tax=Rhodovarius crocodyli TaxID=1979269 RepID=A0A437MMB9_9PROT|nr:DNA helicase RecQ [Rhodovarius crocodyli]RVT98785.1 DNA helicase RecQ [Rhodovarius crocodyli]